MLRYILKRLVHGVFVVWAVATLIFLFVRAIPGDPINIILGRRASPEARQALRQELHLDGPLYLQYISWMERIIRGDLGTSITRQVPVTELIVQTSAPTLSVAALGMSIAVLIAIPTGIISAVYKDRWQDYTATFIAFFGLSMPAFWIGILSIAIVVHFEVINLPIYGYASLDEGFITWLRHVILPSMAVGIPFAGFIMRMMRSSMLEVMNADYMRTARAKGLNNRLILFKHGFQNALLPVITLSGILLGALLAGVVAVEIVFGYQGFGALLVNSVNNRDYPVIQGIAIVIAMVFVLINLAIDISYTAINPKIRYEGGNE